MSTVYPLSLPPALRRELRGLATETGLSISDVMQQSMQLGAPLLRERLAVQTGRVTNVEPLPPRVWRRIYARRRPDDDADPQLLAAQSNVLEAD